MGKNVFLGVIVLLSSGFIISCGSTNTGGGSFGKPSQPVLDPMQGSYTFVDDAQRPTVTITSNDSVRYTYSISGPPADPACDLSGSTLEYTGPFQIGGPNETVNLKAIACIGDASSVVVWSGDYVFSP